MQLLRRELSQRARDRLDCLISLEGQPVLQQEQRKELHLQRKMQRRSLEQLMTRNKLREKKRREAGVLQQRPGIYGLLWRLEIRGNIHTLLFGSELKSPSSLFCSQKNAMRTVKML